MSRVDKVIISTHAIMANGGLVAHAGAYQIALAAKVSYFFNFLLLYRNFQYQLL
jgi:translation initiation factor 2B subunit (eIF-2B alpha/beta/delta family)